MPDYLASYTIKACMFDGGCWMHDPDPHHREYRFPAQNDREAKKIAEDHQHEIAKNFFGPNITLDRILRVEEIRLKR